MGGRGSSSGGRESGPGNVSVSNETSLVSAREGKQREVDQTLETFKTFEKAYGEQIGDIMLADMKGTRGNPVGCYGMDTVLINKKYFDAEKMNKAMDIDAKSGHSVSRGNKSGLQMVAAHEIGHHLTDVAARKMGVSNLQAAANVIVNNARKNTGDRGVVILASKISRYATTNNAETIAEAVADVYCNGSRAKSQSRAVVQELNRQIGVSENTLL